MGAIMSMGVATQTAFWSSPSPMIDLRRRKCVQSGTRGRGDALAARDHDSHGNDYRHDSDVTWLGEGGEQNAPLGSAVIGGLMFATIATLFFVPVVFSLVHSRKKSAE